MAIAAYIFAYDIFNIYFRRLCLKYMPNDIDHYSHLAEMCSIIVFFLTSMLYSYNSKLNKVILYSEEICYD